MFFIGTKQKLYSVVVSEVDYTYSIVARQTAPIYSGIEITSVVMLDADRFALIHMKDSDVHIYDILKQQEIKVISIPDEKQTFWNSLVPFGTNEKLQTAYLLLKGMRTLNLIDMQSGEVILINQSKLDMFGSNNTISYSAIVAEMRQEGDEKDTYNLSILQVENNATLSEIIVDFE